MLQDAEFLKKKGLEHQSSKILEKTMKFSAKHDLLFLQIEVLDRLRLFTKESKKTKIRTHIFELASERDSIMQGLLIHHKVSDLFDVLFSMVRREFTFRNQEDISRLELLREKFPELKSSANLTLRTQAYFAQINAFYHQLKGEYDLARKYYSSFLDLWENQPERMQADRINYKISPLSCLLF